MKRILLPFLVAVGLFLAVFLYPVGVMWGIIPNQEAYNRTAYYYEQQTMRDIAVGLEARHEKTHDYPPGKFYWGPLDEKLVREIGVDWEKMIDPFNRDGDSKNWRKGPNADVDRGARIRVRGLDYQYYTDGKDFWAVVGRGPDGRLDLTTSVLHQAQAQGLSNTDAYKVPFASLANATYDPSNGTISSGDVWRFKEY